METILSVVSTVCLATVGWAFSLNAKVAVLEEKEQGLRELIESRFDGVDQRLDRIERSMNGSLK